MLKPHLFIPLLIGVIFLSMTSSIMAQDGELAATLEVLEAGVEVQRVNTSNWIAVNLEAIVGVGDVIRTDDTGRARITFFADGVDTDVLPHTEYRIEQFQGSEENFDITVEILIGQTLQRLNRVLDANSSYNINTPAMTLGARGTEFAVRVDESGKRTMMLVSEGLVEAQAEDASADVPAEFGVRRVIEEEISDVVRASTFAELAAALDGCSVRVTTPDDVSMNVRISPRRDAPRVGTIAADEIGILMGQTEGRNWYRINFRDGFGWILSTSATIDSACAGLRVFPDNYGPEDVSLYSSLGNEVNIEDMVFPEATAEPQG